MFVLLELPLYIFQNKFFNVEAGLSYWPKPMGNDYNKKWLAIVPPRLALLGWAECGMAACKGVVVLSLSVDLVPTLNSNFGVFLSSLFFFIMVKFLNNLM